MAIGQQVSIASKNYCYICVIFSNNDIAITIFVCMIYMEPERVSVSRWLPYKSHTSSNWNILF